MNNDRKDIDYMLDELGVTNSRSRDLLTPGLHGLLDKGLDKERAIKEVRSKWDIRVPLK